MPAMEKEMLSAALAQSDTKVTGSKLDFYMQHYRPYVRPDLSLNQLSIITNIPAPILEAFYESTAQTLEQYLDGWRVRHTKNLMKKENIPNLDLKSISSLSGFSSIKKFAEAFKKIEGISPEIYQSQINESK